MMHMRSGVGAHVPTAALLAAAAMLLALPAAGGTSNRFDLPWECIEASSVLLHASLDSNDSSPAAWPWIGRMPYNPVLLERLRQTAHLDGTTRRCLSMVEVESMSGRWPLCVDAGRPPVGYGHQFQFRLFLESTPGITEPCVCVSQNLGPCVCVSQNPFFLTYTRATDVAGDKVINSMKRFMLQFVQKRKRRKCEVDGESTHERGIRRIFLCSTLVFTTRGGR